MISAGKLLLASGIFLAAAISAGSVTDTLARSPPPPNRGLYDLAPLDDPSIGRCYSSDRTQLSVFRESDHIRGYFAPADLDSYRRALPAPFTWPDKSSLRPMIRIAFSDHYDTAEGSPHREAEVAMLGMAGTQAGWVVLTLPVTDGISCITGRKVLGLPMIVRRVTLERFDGRYVGTFYAVGGERPLATLIVDTAAPVESTRDLLRQYGQYPRLALLQGQVMKYGDMGQSHVELTPASGNEIRLGRAQLEVSREPDNLLRRLGVGAPLAAHWSRLRARHTIAPM